MSKFNWGDTVKIRTCSPKRFTLVPIGSICGMRTISSSAVAEEFDVPLGGVLYLLESEDGTTAEIPEIYLEAV